MHSPNGVGTTLVAPDVTLGNFLPEQRGVVLNGNRYVGWVTTNKRYPRWIMAKLDRLARAYARVIDPLLEDDVVIPESTDGQTYNIYRQQLEDQVRRRLQAADLQQEAYNEYVTQSLVLLVPTLLESEVELIPLEVATKTLADLGYFDPEKVDADVDEEVDKDLPPLIGDTSLDDSPASIPGTPTNAS